MKYPALICVLALLTRPSLANETFGRLFNTPEERTRIDQSSQAHHQPSLDGEIRRGQDTLGRWLDGEYHATPHRKGSSSAPSIQPPTRRPRSLPP